MCFCCCDSRKSILIYMIVTTSFAFIYGIIALSQFGSSTDIYKSFINKIEKLESSGSSNTNPYGRRMQYPYYGNDPYYDQAWDLLDNDSKERIEKLTTDDLNNNAYGMIKSLKGIENGLGVLLFVFIIIFLGFEIEKVQSGLSGEGPFIENKQPGAAILFTYFDFDARETCYFRGVFFGTTRHSRSEDHAENQQ